MTGLTAASPWHMALAYAVLLVPQLNLLNKVYDQHVGNIVPLRIAGLSLREVACRMFFMPLTAALFAALRDVFGGDARRYKAFHVAVASLQAPLLYVFMLQLGGSAQAALYAALVYALVYNFPVTLNYLMQPEHYELLCVLGGGTLCLHGLATGQQWAVLCGGLLLGLAGLFKVPPLASLGLMGYLYWTHFRPDPPAMLPLLAAFALPGALFLLVLAGSRLAQRRKGRPEAPNSPAPPASPSADERRADRAAWVQNNVVTPVYSHLLELLLPLFAACLYLALGDGALDAFFAITLPVAALIFVLRRCFWYTYSLILLLCMAAGLGLELMSRLDLAPLWAFAGLLCVVTGLRIFIYAPRHWVYTFRPAPFAAGAVLAAEHARAGGTGNTGLFVNIRGPHTYLYLLAQRALSRELPYVLWTARNLLGSGGDAVAGVLRGQPPAHVIVKLDEPHIVEMGALEALCGCRYEAERRFGEFLVYRRLAGPVEPAPRADAAGLYSPDPARIRADAQRLADAATGGSPCAA